MNQVLSVPLHRRFAGRVIAGVGGLLILLCVYLIVRFFNGYDPHPIGIILDCFGIDHSFQSFNDMQWDWMNLTTPFLSGMAVIGFYLCLAATIGVLFEDMQRLVVYGRARGGGTLIPADEIGSHTGD